mmetsp:Transcript_16435/g.23761  ORF Transcript_16435/g.23761 Transcript_16435/m.23761 type:complete len:138 (+) Transcript_16435:274-687(+)
MIAFVGSTILRAVRGSTTSGPVASSSRMWYGSLFQRAPSSRSLARVFMTTGPERDTVVDTCRMKLTEALKPLQLNIIPAYGDPNGSHITIEVVSDLFEGESVVARHRMIYKAIWDELQGPIHAVDSIEAKSPSEAGL